MDKAEELFQEIKIGLEEFQKPSSVSTFMMLVSVKRDKFIRLDRYPLHGSVTGMCVALIDCDLIRICTDADSVLEKWTLTHELCHLYIGHIARISIPISYNEFLSLPQDVLRYLYHRSDTCLLHSGFETPREDMTETVATKLMSYFEDAEHNLPNLRVYGYD